MTRRHAYHGPADAEVAMWPGVTVTRAPRGKHLSLILHFVGLSRFVTYPVSPSDHRGAHRHVQDIRLALNALGALRLAPKGAANHIRQLETA